MKTTDITVGDLVYPILLQPRLLQQHLYIQVGDAARVNYARPFGIVVGICRHDAASTQFNIHVLIENVLLRYASTELERL